MNYLTQTISILIITFICISGIEAQNKATLSGYIKDAKTGEDLIGATIYIRETNYGSISNHYGFYSVSLLPGTYHISFAYLGYNEQERILEIDKDVKLTINLEPKTEQLSEVFVSSTPKDKNITNTQMGVQKLQGETIKNVPVLMGETDLIKVIQLLPGVQATSEGSSGFSVRGGNPDQNLILLDEANVYNAGHMLGFFSVFNNDAMKDVVLHKGDIPASSGGRLASLLDIRMKDGNNKNFSGTGGIGTISSRLTLEGPIKKDKTAFIVSGRRTYLDLFLPFSSDPQVRDNQLYFYDLNAKINHQINDNNRVFFSGYFGRDVFKNNFSKMSYGNQTVTFRWNHVYNPRLFSNLTFITSNYQYGLGTNESGANSFEWKSNLNDYSLKLDYNFFLNPRITLNFGGQSIWHNMSPGHAYGKDENSLYSELKVPISNSLEHAFYISNTHQLLPQLTLRYGIRYSLFQNIGEGTLFHYNENGEVNGQTSYSQGEIYHHYHGLEPRVGMTYRINTESSVKAAWAKTRQYLQMASNSTSSSPLDVWFPASPNVKPQLSDQFSIGYFRNFVANTIETSVEGFYKQMYNTIDFKDHPELLLNEHLEGELRFGESWAYGLEFLVKFTRPNWNGWVGYTWSKAERRIDGINNNQTYLSPYDHTHDCSIVLNRKLTARTQLSANWVYYTGAPVTFPIGRYESGGVIVPLYSSRNGERMPDYHRLDISYILKGKNIKNRKWQGEWVFSVYNAYGQKNPWAINFVNDEDDPYIMHAEKTYLFSFIPSVTYNFKF
jgi:hypothetical protein